MRYLDQAEILSYINAGKEIEQSLGEFYSDNFRCFRHVTLGKNKDSYYGLIFEKFDDSSEGLTSVYDFSSVDPDNHYGVEIGPFDSLDEVIETINKSVKLNSDKYLISGHLNDEIKKNLTTLSKNALTCLPTGRNAA